MVDTNKPTAPQTRQVETGAGAIAATAGAGGVKAPGTVGKATVERMISQTVQETKSSQTKKFGLIAAAAAMPFDSFRGVIGGEYWYSNP